MNPEYFQSDFDPAALTIPKLKSALVDAGIDIPMKQERKAFYVDLFRREIMDNAGKLQARRKVRPSAAGILAVSKNGSPQVEQTAELQAQSVAKRRKSTKFSSSSDNPFQSPSASAKKQPEKFMNYVDTASLPIAGYVDSKASSNRYSWTSSSLLGIVKQVIAALAIVASLSAAFGGMAQYYFYKSLPYCLSSKSDLIDCHPCPLNAKCKMYTFTCLSGYVFRYRPFPLNSFCAQDKDRESNVDKLLSRMTHIVSQNAGAYQCGQALSDQVKQETLEAQAKHYFSWPDAQFQNYWNAALEKIQFNSSEYGLVVSSAMGQLVFSSVRPVIGFACRFKKFIADHQYHFLGLFTLLCFLLFIYLKIQSRRSRAKRLAELIDSVVTVLIEQESRFRSGQETKSALSVNHLRDFFLNKEPLRERTRLWNEIRQEILHNSSVRETAILIEGEQHDAWQWIGTSSLLSPNKKR